jgi:hypothetical protein
MNDDLNTDLNTECNTDPVTGLELVGCPACAAPAEVVERFVLNSTDGPIEHATVRCADRHRFTVLVERLTSGQPQDQGAGRWASR